jgi:WD40 repeat protein
MEGHTSQVLSRLFNVGGDRLISSSANNTIRIWDMATGNCTTLLQEHRNWVWFLAQNLDSSILFSRSQDETIQVWQLETGSGLKTLRCSRPYEGTIITGVRGVTEAEEVTLQALGTI